MKRANGNHEIRAPLVALLIVIPLLLTAGFGLYYAVARTGDQQTTVRIAQTARARILRFQVDEETGIRGYGWTRDRLYLEPYHKARLAMDKALAQLRTAVKPLQESELNALVNEEERINAKWIATIAEPLVTRADRSPTMLELNRRGKATIDDFRNYDQRLSKALDDAAIEADRQSRNLFGVR